MANIGMVAAAGAERCDAAGPTATTEWNEAAAAAALLVGAEPRRP